MGFHLFEDGTVQNWVRRFGFPQLVGLLSVDLDYAQTNCELIDHHRRPLLLEVRLLFLLVSALVVVVQVQVQPSKQIPLPVVAVVAEFLGLVVVAHVESSPANLLRRPLWMESFSRRRQSCLVPYM